MACSYDAYGHLAYQIGEPSLGVSLHRNIQLQLDDQSNKATVSCALNSRKNVLGCIKNKKILLKKFVQQKNCYTFTSHYTTVGEPELNYARL